MARILRGDIFWANLNPTVGNEQAGFGPVLIISENVFNERSETKIGLAITSQPQRAEFPLTRAQFLSALAFIRRDKPAAAIRFRDRTETILRRLEDFPESGRVVPEFPDLPYREVIIPPYRFFYRIKGDVVWIVAVWHGAHPGLRSVSID